MAGPLKTKGRETFAQELAKGTPQAEAYAKAGFRGGKTAAANMAARPDVKARVAELLQRAANRAEVTVADIARQLDEDRDFARDLKAPSAAVQASMGKAKVLGLIIERHRHGLDLSGATDEELEILERLFARSSPGA